MTRASIVSLLVLVLLSAAPAMAFIDPPQLTPNPASAGETVTISIRYGQCDGFLAGDNNPQIAINGNRIDLLFRGVRREDPIFCNIQIGTISRQIGQFSPGEYEVTARFRWQPLIGPEQTIVLATLPLTIQGGESVARPVPIGGWPIAVIAILVLAVVARARHTRQLLSIPALVILGSLVTTSHPALATSENPRLYALLSGDPGALGVDAILASWSTSNRMTTGLYAQNPIRVWSYIPIRATGDFKILLDNNPSAERAKLERYIVVEYPPSADIAAAKLAILADSNFSSVHDPIPMEFSSVTLQSFIVEPSFPMGNGANYGLSVLNLLQAWDWAGGHGLVGIADTGLATAHDELRPFTSGGAFTRGNFLPIYSIDVGRWPDGIDFNVDERELEPVASPHPSCGLDANGMGRAAYVGHGTHVAGLVAANPHDTTAVQGVCKNCGLGMFKITYPLCEDGAIYLEMNGDAVGAAVTLLGDVGAQVINMSFGGSVPSNNYCQAASNDPWCLAIKYTSERDVVLVGASGNRRDEIDFPARDPRVVAAGGTDPLDELWNEDKDPFPDHRDDCPIPNSDRECGSNYTVAAGHPKQEIVSPAQAVYSTVYPGFDWNPFLACGDSFGPGGNSDGYGNCTGTSMSAPQLAGVFGLVRSVNPLLIHGNPENGTVFGVRDVLATTTQQAQASIPWGNQLGYGIPDAEAAVKRMLGKTAGRTVRNRATPLFSFYGNGAKDYAYTTSPQTAIALLINNASNYATNGANVPGYAAFPSDPLIPPGTSPKANVFVMSTEYKTHSSHPDLTPLYFFDRARNFPVSCKPGSSGCNVNNRDFLLATGTAEVQALNGLGYSYRGVEGYVYQRCAPEPACIPQGAQKLWRKCKTADDDCAIFLENQRTTFEANGYTASVPTGYNQHIGYAYPNIDTDGDGLIDGLEHLIGTSHTHADTDGDGVNDGVEFPLAQVSNSDPCQGPQPGRCPADKIFANGFQ